MPDQVAIVVEFAYAVEGRTRDECTELADKVATDMLMAVGGEPWQMQDDDWQRIHVSQLRGGPVTLADDEGFFYRGRRRYTFNGPFLGHIPVRSFDGFKPQKQIEEER